jgi:DNA-binding NarL/FixJ family response regulator
MMPDADGIQLYEELERHAPGLLERIVFMTGGPFTPAARQFLSATHHVCLQKPFEATELSRTVREVMARASCEQVPVDTAV